MKEKFPSLIAIALLLLLVAATWWAVGNAERAIPIDPPRRLTHEMDSWSRNFVMLRSDKTGAPVNRLEGDYGQHFPDDDSYKIDNPRAIGLQPGNPVTIGVARTAIMDQGGKRIVMSGEAHVHRNQDAERAALDITSQKLTLMPDEDVVFTDLPAKVTQGQSRMNGTGMRYNNKTRQLEVYSATDVEIANAESRRRPPPAENSPSPPKKP